MFKVLTYLNSFQKHFSSHVLLYHSTYSQIPSDLMKGLHNVSPNVLKKQVKWLKKYFDIVTIDQLFKTEHINGKVAITFDDGYNSVFENIVPIIKSLNVPITIFINGARFEGKPFWRDKIRYFINHSLEKDFIKFVISKKVGMNLNDKNFYFDTKSEKVNSIIIDKLCDEFVSKFNLEIEFKNYCFESIGNIINHPLISYGNHSYNHYVLSSLSIEEQENEIGKNHEILKKMGSNISNVFSIPFGGKNSYNTDTIQIIKEFGYQGILLPDDLLNLNFLVKYQSIDQIKYLQRYLVPETFNLFQLKILKVFVKSFIKTP